MKPGQTRPGRGGQEVPGQGSGRWFPAPPQGGIRDHCWPWSGGASCVPRASLECCPWLLSLFSFGQGTGSIWAHVAAPGSLLLPAHSLIQHHSFHQDHTPPMNPSPLPGWSRAQCEHVGGGVEILEGGKAFLWLRLEVLRKTRGPNEGGGHLPKVMWLSCSHPDAWSW